MTAPDEPTVAALRRLAAAHAPDEEWQPDPAAVLRRGRVLRARRTTGTASAGALVLALVVGVSAALSGHGAPPVEPGRPTSSATATAEPTTSPSPSPAATQSPLGDSEVATLDFPNLYAVNHPATSSPTQVVARGVGGVDVIVDRDGDHGVEVTLDASANHGKTATERLAWPADERESDYSADANPYPVPTVTTAFTEDFQYAYLLGTVPSWLTGDVRVLLYGDAGWTLPDGSTTRLAEVPTFRAPTDDGRLMFVVTGAGHMALQWLADQHPAIVFMGDEGTYVPGCYGDLSGGCDAIPFPAQVLTMVPVQFTAVPGSSTPPTDESTGPSTSSSLSTLAHGIAAVTDPGTPVTADGHVFDLGPFDGATAHLTRDGTDSDSLVELTASKGDDGTEIVGKGVLGAYPLVLSTEFDDPADGVFTFGVVPPGWSDVHVFYRDDAFGFSLPDGTTRHVLEVPTFLMPPIADRPIEDSRQWFVVGFSGDAARQLAEDRPYGLSVGVVFVAADGTVRDSACGLAPCTDDAARADYATMRSH